MMVEHDVLHIMPKEKFTNGFIAFTRDAFPEKRIAFIVYGSDKREGYFPVSDSFSLAIKSPTELNKSIACKKLINSSGAIVINWVEPQVVLRTFRWLGKARLFFWGGDLYPFSSQVCTNNPKYIVKRAIMRLAISRAAGILTLVPSDLDQVELISKKHGLWHQVMMLGDTRARAVERRSGIRPFRARQGTLRVLLGNSATPTNGHAEALKALSRFAGEDIAVYCPLSYGDAAYGDEVARLGGEMLGDKFVPLRSFMGRDEYDRFLATIDVGVFNHSRQQGLGNINGLMRSGAKVYISRRSGMWRDFGDEGRVFFPTESILSQSFEEFAEWDAGSAERNMELLDPVAQYKRGVALWREVYEEITR